MAQDGPAMNYDLGPDDQEIIRLSAQHEIMTAAYDKLILAPIDLSHPSLRILDSATANGLWLRDIQSVLPASHALVGTDINPNLFPPTAPSQTHFQVQDITKPWPEEWTGSFDLVHSRVALAGCGQFPIEKAVKNMIALIKPGGWIQLEEMELGEQAKLPRIGGEVAKLIKAMFAFGGADPLFAVKMKSWMIEAGLENVEEKLIRVPFGATCSDPEIARKGVESLTITANALAYAAKKMSLQGFDEEQLDSIEERARSDLAENGTYGVMINVWGQMPMVSTQRLLVSIE